jgi:hypothetical protein
MSLNFQLEWKHAHSCHEGNCAGHFLGCHCNGDHGSCGCISWHRCVALWFGECREK